MLGFLIIFGSFNSSSLLSHYSIFSYREQNQTEVVSKLVAIPLIPLSQNRISETPFQDEFIASTKISFLRISQIFKI